MARKKTDHGLVNEGRTGRIIARRALRRGLGNPKKRHRDLAELMNEMFFKGVLKGRKLENLRIIYATAGMEYGESYPVAELEAVHSTTLVDLAPAVARAYDPPTLDAYAKADARGAEGVDAYGGSYFP